MMRLQSNHFNIYETASKVEFHVEWQVELQGVKEVGWIDENLTQCWVRSPIFGYRMDITHLKKKFGALKKNWVFLIAYTKCGAINPIYERYMFPYLVTVDTTIFKSLRLRGSSSAKLPASAVPRDPLAEGENASTSAAFSAVNPIYPLVICYIQRKWPWK